MKNILIIFLKNRFHLLQSLQLHTQPHPIRLIKLRVIRPVNEWIIFSFTSNFKFHFSLDYCPDRYLNNSGYFYSPNYPNNYPNYVDCYWYLDTLNSNGIALYFLTFVTEPGVDYLKVFVLTNLSFRFNLWTWSLIDLRGLVHFWSTFTDSKWRLKPWRYWHVSN